MLKATTSSTPTSHSHQPTLQAFTIKALEIFIPLSVLGFIVALNFGLHFVPEVGYSISPIGCAGFCLLVGGIAVTSTALISYVVMEKQLAIYAIYHNSEQNNKTDFSSYEKIEFYLHLGLSHLPENKHQAHVVNFSSSPNIQAEDSNHQAVVFNYPHRFFSATPTPCVTENRDEKATFNPQL